MRWQVKVSTSEKTLLLLAGLVDIPVAFAYARITTACFDLKKAYQESRCCSQSITVKITCGDLLSSYTSLTSGPRATMLTRRRLRVWIFKQPGNRTISASKANKINNNRANRRANRFTNSRANRPTIKRANRSIAAAPLAI